MTKKITLLILVLFITTLGFAQQMNPEHHPLVRDGKKHFPVEAKYEHFHTMHYILSGNNHLKSSPKNFKDVETNKQTLDSLIYYDRDTSTSQWTNSDKYEYTYDANESLTLLIRYKWNDSTSRWTNSNKYEYTYDTNKTLRLKIVYDWDDSTSQWTNSDKYEYTYDANENLELIIGNKWNDSTSQWVIYKKDEYTYDTNGYLTTVITYYYSTNSSQWFSYFKYDYIYDANGYLLSRICYYWNTNTSQWTSFWKAEFTYDENGNQTSRTTYDRHNNNGQWSVIWKDEYNYDLSVNTSDLIMPYWNYNFSSNKLLGFVRYIWDATTNNLVKLEKDTLFYSEDNAGVSESFNENVILYPNPASNTLSIKFTGNSGRAVFELFDMQGRKLVSQEVSTKEQINLNHLSSGSYIYTISIDGNKKSGELIKR